jgi:hypothetical protein
MSFKEIIDKHETMKVYKHAFSTYQDMIDGQFIMEFSDEEDEAAAEAEDDNDSLPELIDIEPKNLENSFNSAEEVEEEEQPEDVMSELSEEDLNTISVIEEVFKYSKKISNSNKELRKELEELRDVVNDMGIFIKFASIAVGFIALFIKIKGITPFCLSH